MMCNNFPPSAQRGYSKGVQALGKDLNTVCIDQRATAGQAIVEFVLMLTLTLLVSSIISKAFKDTILALWSFYTTQIAPACPGCLPGGNYTL